MSLRRDVTVAWVRIDARHAPELIGRLRRKGYPSVAAKVERAVGLRTIHVDFNAAERAAITWARLPTGAPQFSELYDVLRGEPNGNAPSGTSRRWLGIARLNKAVKGQATRKSERGERPDEGEAIV